MTTMLVSLAEGADALVTGVSYEELAADVAEYCQIPLATVLWFPIRVNGRLAGNLPAAVTRSAMRLYEWLVWRGVSRIANAQRGKWVSAGVRPGAGSDRGTGFLGDPGLPRRAVPGPSS